MKRPITFLKLAIVFLAFLSVPGIVWGVGTINSGFKVEKYSTGASSLTVDATSLGSACYRVSNNSNIDYFIPTSTSTEWNAFKNKVEAGNLSGVSLSLCTACTTIGNYCWTTQNLNVGTQVTGGTTPSDNGVVEKYCYNDDPAYCNTYGGLYSAQEMMKYLSGSGIQGICPDGFHLPTTTEVSDLIASGSSLFQGLMGGRYLPGSSYNLQGSYGLYWASPMYNAYYQAGIGAAITNWISQADGFNSVRCVRNPLSCVAGSYNNNGTCSTCPTGSWCYASVKNFCTAGTYNAYTGKSSADDCLPCDAGYTSLAGSDNINDCAAVPPTSCAYLGSYCWTTQSSNVGTQIAASATPSNNGVVEKYCYLDDPANCNTYGGFYTLNEATNYSTVSGVKGICPSGFHVPSTTEFDDLIVNLPLLGNSLFQGLSAGYTQGGSFAYFGSYGFYWSSGAALSAYLQPAYGPISYWTNLPSSYAISLRCVRDAICTAGQISGYSYNNINPGSSQYPVSKSVAHGTCTATVNCSATSFPSINGESATCDAGYFNTNGLCSDGCESQCGNGTCDIAAGENASNCIGDCNACTNGATRWMYDSGNSPVGCGTYCRSEQQTCVNGAWNGSYTGTADCSASDSERVGYQTASVNCGSSCVAQTQTCAYNGWNLSGIGSCSVNCFCVGATLDGYTYNNINYSASQYPVSKTVTQGTCTATVNCSAIGGVSVSGEVAACSAGYFNANGSCADGCESQCGNGTCDTVAGETITNCAGDCTVCTNGATRTRYDSGTSPFGCGVYCRSELQTCVSNAWNGSYTGISDCSALASIRTGYTTSSVTCGNTCSTQAQVCSHDGWNGTGIGSCSVDTCICAANTLNGYTYNNINYNSSQASITKNTTPSSTTTTNCKANVSCSGTGVATVTGEVATCVTGWFDNNSNCSADGCESQCGNDVCDTAAGETVANCANDCTVCTNGETRTRWDSGAGANSCGTYCRSEVQTCVNNAWNGTYTGTNDCT
ncbi:MAG: FISUMP domain-containing protein, partial [Patescibacteria group bacterium]